MISKKKVIRSRRKTNYTIPTNAVRAKARAEYFDMKWRECKKSLLKAIHDAGGMVPEKRLAEMSLYDFMHDIAGTNNIRFIYDPVDSISGLIAERSF